MNLSPEDIEYLNANFPSMWRELREGDGKIRIAH